MSFNRLPTETKQQVVDLCHQADEAYWARTGRNRGARKGHLEGRSLSSISRVSRPLRDMAMKYLFKTLSASKASKDVFIYSILGRQASQWITHVQFGALRSRDLRHLVIHILPRLPNLCSISDLSSYTIADLTGSSSLAALSTRQMSLQETRAREVLLEVAAKIQDWDLQVREEDLKVLLGVNTQKVERLKIWPFYPSLITLELDGSPLPSLLQGFDYLRSLSLVELDATDPDYNFASAPHEHDYQQALQVNYSFRTTLRSLSLSLDPYRDRNGLGFLRFASHFPGLLHFCITCKSVRFKEEEETLEVVSFSSLCTLEIDEPWSLTSIKFLLDSLSLPSLLHLSVSKLHESVYDEEEEVVQQIAKKVRSQIPSLRTFSLTSRDKAIMEELRHLRQLLEPTLAVKVVQITGTRSKSRNSDTSTDSADELNAMRGDYEELLSEVDSDDPEAADRIDEKTNQVLSWANEHARGIAGRDMVGGKQLLKALAPLRKFKKWMLD